MSRKNTPATEPEAAQPSSAPATEPEAAQPSSAKTGVVRVRSVNPNLIGYFVLGRDPSGSGFELDLSTLTDTQRRDLFADVCVAVEPIEG